jgi:hypothetical protein
MAKIKEGSGPVDPAPLKGPQIDLTGNPPAPIIYFDEAPFLGQMNGVFRICLAAYQGMLSVAQPSDNHNPIAVAHLRGNAQALLALRAAIDSALLLAAPAAGEGRNN